MINALLLIFEPVAAWERIVEARRKTLTILLLYLFPFLALNCVAEGYGLVHSGKWQGQVAHLRKFSVNEAVLFEVAQFFLSLLIVFIGAKLIKSVGETFHGRHTFNQSFTAVAYGLGPFLLFRFLDALSLIHIS